MDRRRRVDHHQRNDHAQKFLKIMELATVSMLRALSSFPYFD